MWCAILSNYTIVAITIKKKNANHEPVLSGYYVLSTLLEAVSQFYYLKQYSCKIGTEIFPL